MHDPVFNPVYSQIPSMMQRADLKFKIIKI